MEETADNHDSGSSQSELEDDSSKLPKKLRTGSLCAELKPTYEIHGSLQNYKLFMLCVHTSKTLIW